MRAEPIADVESPHFRVQYRINNEWVGEQRVHDPLMNANLVIGWRDLLKLLWQRKCHVEVIVRASDEMTRAVMWLATQGTSQPELDDAVVNRAD